MIRALRIGAAIALVVGVGACVPPPQARSPLFARVEAERAGPLVAQVHAEPEVAEVDALIAQAAQRESAGDSLAVELLLERARAGMELAITRGRRGDALERARVAKLGTAEATSRLESVTATASDEEQAVDLAVTRLAEARARAWGSGLDAVDGVRDRVRLRAAEATLLDAREDCAFAVALGAKGPRLEKAQALVKAAERRVGTGTTVLDAATRARTACLGLHAPETARAAERRVSTLDRGVDLAASMGLEPMRDSIGLTFAPDESGAENDVLIAFVKAFGASAIIVERWGEPHAATVPDPVSVELQRVLSGGESALVVAPKMVLAEHGKRRIVVRVAPRFGSYAEDTTSAPAEP